MGMQCTRITSIDPCIFASLQCAKAAYISTALLNTRFFSQPDRFSMTQRRVALCPFTVTQEQHRGSVVEHRRIASPPARARIWNGKGAACSGARPRSTALTQSVEACYVRRKSKHQWYCGGRTFDVQQDVASGAAGDFIGRQPVTFSGIFYAILSVTI
jgi:hypothetical protein